MMEYHAATKNNENQKTNVVTIELSTFFGTLFQTDFQNIIDIEIKHCLNGSS